jgi:shikimate dehydrogenase
MKDRIQGSTRLFAIFGHPLTYTLSPAFQNAGLAALGLDAAYVPMPVPPAGFAAAFCGFQALESSLGANITNPHKQAVLPLLDRISPEARAIGAVNTVWRQGRRWAGGNTDWSGFLAAASAMGEKPLAGRRAFLLGAGGAARGLAYACLKGSARQVLVLARRPAQARQLALALDPQARRVKAAPLDLALLDSAQAGDWLINTIPDPGFSRRCGLALAGKPRLRVFDIVYQPLLTPLLASAKKGGHQALGGLGMLLEQGAQALEIWSGKEAPRQAMARALQAALRQRKDLTKH